MGKSIKKNFLYNILLNVSKVIFPLITAPYVSRVLEPGGVGLYNFANTYANWFALFAALGIPLYGIRGVAKIGDDLSKQRDFVSEIISISILATLLCVFFFLLTLFFVPQLHENYLVFLIAATILYITPFKIDWFFSGKEEFAYITIRSLIIKTISIVLLFLLVKNKSHLLVYVSITAFSQIANEIWNYYKLYKSGIHPYFTFNGLKHVRPLLMLFFSSISVSIYTILDTLMLGFFTSYDEVGYYSCVTHISKAILPLVTSLSIVAIPRVSTFFLNKKWEQINALMNKSFSFVSFIAFPITFGIIAIAPVFVPLFFGVKFVNAVFPLQIISIIIISIGLNNLLGIQFLAGIGYDKQLMFSITIGAISNLLLNFCLIPLLGASGACISSVCSETIILFVMMYYVYTKTKIRFKYKELLYNCLISIVLLFIVKFLGYFLDGWILIFIFGFVSVVFYSLTQYLIKNSSMLYIIEMLLNNFRKINK